jgi:pyridoxine/pyridoxamine 5'-phosphate oxidase
MIKIDDMSNTKPYKKFKSLYNKALAHNQESIEAIAISSFNKEDNQVQSRYVNLKYIIENNWVFFTNFNSTKAKSFSSHDQISALIYWGSVGVQIRMMAKISKTDASFSDEHFKGRDRAKNALAISSFQSAKIDSYNQVVKNFNKINNSRDTVLNRPSYWGGYSFTPFYFEFWESHESRLNKREVFENSKDVWHKFIIQP